MRFIYATRSVLPSATANSVQSAHMACELAALNPGDFVALYRTRHASAPPASHFSNYGLPAPAAAHAIKALSPSWDWLPLDLLQARRFFRRHAPASALVYTRSLRLASCSVAANLTTFLELHDPLTTPRIVVLKRLLATGRLRGLVATTARLGDDLRAALPALPRDSLLVAGNGAPATTLAMPPLPLPDRGEFNIGYAGSAFRGKGIEIVLACAALMPDATFHVIGPDAKACAPLGPLSPNLRFTGRRPQPETLGLLKSMDALLLPNQRSVIIRSGADIGQHTSPLKLFEYMAAGRPIVASDLPVFHGILRDDDNALLSSADSAEAFVRQLHRLRADPALAARVAETARCDFIAHHTWSRRALRIQNFMTSSAA